MIRKILGLRQRISRAKSEDEINQLLAEGAAFPQAAARTQRAWKLTAKRRRSELIRNEKGTKTVDIQTRIDNGNGVKVSPILGGPPHRQRSV